NSQLAGLSAAPAQNGEYDVSEDTGAAYTPDDTEFNVFNTDRKLSAIQGLANLLKHIPGKKIVMQFTGGITQTGEENRTELEAATDAANRANVSFYTIDARGLMAETPGGDATQAHRPDNRCSPALPFSSNPNRARILATHYPRSLTIRAGAHFSTSEIYPKHSGRCSRIPPATT